MRIVQFGELTLPDFNGTQQLPVPFRSSVVTLRGGGFDQDGRKSYLETKMLGANFWVRQDDGNVDTIIDNLYKESGKGRRILKATMRDNTTQRQQFVKLIQASTKPDSRTYAIDSSSTECYEAVQCQWEMVYPYWEASADLSWFLDTGLVLNDGLFLDAGNTSSATLSTTLTSKTITNSGNTAMEKFTLTIVGNAGVTITNITIENTTTGETLEWVGTLSEDDILTIQSLEQTIKYNGANAYTDTTLGTNQVGFFTLELDDNDFEITLDSISGGTATATWGWAKHYIR
jgi:hypothetical protein